MLWDRFEAGESLRSISRALGRAPSSVRTYVVAAGWRRPVPAGDWCALRLSFREREVISRGIAAGVLLRCIARRLRRSGGETPVELIVRLGWSLLDTREVEILDHSAKQCHGLPFRSDVSRFRFVELSAEMVHGCVISAEYGEGSGIPAFTLEP